MPQDLSNELKSDWSAKSFTRLGRTAIAAIKVAGSVMLENSLKILLAICNQYKVLLFLIY